MNTTRSEDASIQARGILAAVAHMPTRDSVGVRLQYAIPSARDDPVSRTQRPSGMVTAVVGH